MIIYLFDEIDIVRRIRRWAAIAFIATLVAACFSIILIGLDAKAVQDGHDLSNINQIVHGSSYFQPKFRILSAQLAFACLVFLFCLVFITLYIIVFITTPKIRRPYQPGVLPPLRY
jgi:DMSO reductase anchor subunit